MGLNDTPSSQRIHIAFFGCRNVGKSSLVNAVTGQELAVVSDVKGTTTDPVIKSMELLPLGPVCIIDTPGIDDEGELGAKRIDKTLRTLAKTDIAVLVADSTQELNKFDESMIESFKTAKIPFIIAYNKCDLALKNDLKDNEINVSAADGTNVYELKEMIGKTTPNGNTESRMIGDLISEDDIAVLVTPIDAAAPKARMILPQQMAIRDVLDSDGIAVVTKETQLQKTLASLGEKPKIVVTDSQAFAFVSTIVPQDVPLTSFSILMARYNGYLDMALDAIKALENIKDGDTVLIAEGCTHHRQCGDIGTVKIPKALKKCTGKELNIKVCSGLEFPDDMSGISLVVHCGGCMLNRREVKSRMDRADIQDVPVTNYGILLAHAAGILKRSIAML